MKKLNAIIIAIALVLGLGQCKKQETPTTDTEEDIVYITVNVDNNDAKHIVFPSYGLFGFTSGDKLYVSNDGRYIGTLVYQNGAFSGSIQGPHTNDYLHFYFLGGKGPDSPTAGDESFTINIADQQGMLPILSYGHSTQKYGSSSYYSATLKNKCALVEFAITNEIPASTPISISGMRTEVAINFTENTITPTGNTGDLTLYAESANNRWAILMPGDAVAATASAAGYNSAEVTVPAVAINDYLYGSSAVCFGMTAATTSQGTPLTMEALTGGTIVVQQPQEGMQYTLNGGEKMEMSGDSYVIDVAVGDKVAFYGNGTSITSYYVEGGIVADEKWTRIYGGTAEVKVYGNIMSLVDEEGFDTATELEDNAFFGLFSSEDPGNPNTKLIDASGLLLPATTLSFGCYGAMFYACDHLTAAPVELPAMTLAEGCYSSMFEGCSSLTTAPVLPAMELAEYCYYAMFYGCTSLATAPELPATELVDSCYSSMFQGCSSLSSVTCLATSNIDEYYNNHDWLYGVSASGIFTAASSAEWPTGVNGIPSGWTRVNVQ